MTDVQFDSEQILPAKSYGQPATKRTLIDLLIRSGFASNQRQALILLGIIGGILLLVTTFLLSKTGPDYASNPERLQEPARPQR